MLAWRVNGRVAWDVLRWAWLFYWRHILLIVGISLVPAGQRLVSQLWKAELAGPAAVGLEIVTAAARLLLLGLIVWLAIVRDPELREVSGAEKWARVQAFLRLRWLSLVIFMAMVLGAGLVFDTIPDQLIGRLVPEAEQPPYWGTMLAIKNPTIIAFTLVWWVALARQAMRFQHR